MVRLKTWLYLDGLRRLVACLQVFIRFFGYRVDLKLSMDFSCVKAKKQNGSAFRTNSLGNGARTPPSERKSKFSIGKLLRPWKWKRKRKSDKIEAVSRTLERKISVRANRDELVQKGILLPDSPSPPKSEPGDSPSNVFFPSLSSQGDQVSSLSPNSLPPNIASPQQAAPQHPVLPPPYPNPPPGASPLPIDHHALIQQQLLQNPHFAAARDSTVNGIAPGEYFC
ncbi:hypothetical protein GWI33_014613 [Rhynchophorus ferrugineus]|uniref:Phosphatase and actin regulator n=1 Tax=Rhynchophorus ferrugineus TaxID=354439 RepID=A0A834I6T4_RHYFE|nr:hypothetical protein GWI33_014613 [Rhynchophorus ferrugineus]